MKGEEEEDNAVEEYFKWKEMKNTKKWKNTSNGMRRRRR